MSINFNITAQGGAVNQTDGANGEDTNPQESFANAFQRLSMAGFNESEEIILGMMNSSTGSTDSAFYFNEPNPLDVFTEQDWELMANIHHELSTKSEHLKTDLDKQNQEALSKLHRNHLGLQPLSQSELTTLIGFVQMHCIRPLNIFNRCFTPEEWQTLDNRRIALTNKQGRSMDENTQLDCLQFLIDARSQIPIDPDGDLTADQRAFLMKHSMLVTLARMRFLN